MIYSMTGYAVATAQTPAGGLQLELRAVNHRYLDLAIRLPDELRALETGLREQLNAGLKRGKIECRVALTRVAPDAKSLAINEPLVLQLGALGDLVRARVPDCAPLTVADILRWPGVVVEPAVSFDELSAAVSALARTALVEFSASRSREGAKLKTMLEECCARMESLVTTVAPRLPAIQAVYQDKLAQKLREAGLAPDDERLRQEFALFAAKIDVAEELSRLQTHVAEVRRVLAVGSDAGGSAGKRLDFLMQELNREANTLGSKSVDTGLSQTALELKVSIEQMREQVQNIE
jgi:uncharacterized protein (TIGR00255 family)